MKTTATNRKVRVLLSAIRHGSLIPNPEFQRRLVWTNRDKRNFLQTVLDEYPFPEIYVAAGEVNLETGEGTEMLVDGQQRLTTLQQYFTGSEELKWAGAMPPYSELEDDVKTKFLEYDVVVRDLGSLSLQDMKRVFERINSTSYALNAMEIQNARYNGAFKQFGEAIAEDDFFDVHRVFSASEIRRMEDTRFALGFIITIMSTYFTRDNEHVSYLATYNDEFDIQSDLRKEVRRVFEFVDSCDFGASSRVWKKADIFTLLVEAHRALVRDNLNLNPEAVGKRLKEFYEKVDLYPSSNEGDKPVADYYRAALQATNDRGNRVKRGTFIASKIRGG